jgi:hypothetical protein
MSQEPSAPAPRAEDAISVVSAYGAFRVLLLLLAAWTFFAGFSLLTRGLGAISFGGDDQAAERVVGAHMLVLAPIYLLIAWRRADFRVLIWVPFAGLLAVILPSLWELVYGDFDAALLLTVSIIFLALLVYVWASSRPASFFRVGDGEEDEEYADEDYEEYADDDEGDVGPAAPTALDAASARARRYRRSD